VLAGDHHQLPEIDAGGGFRLLAEALGAGYLTENRRQVAAWERAALAELRAGSVAAALTAYAEHGRIWRADEVDTARAAMVERWWELLNDGVNPSQLVIIAATKDTVHSLGQAVQHRLLSAGRLGRQVAQTDHGCLHIGDRVLATRNDRRVGVRNGQRGTITNAKRSGDLTVAFDDTNKEVDLPGWYVGSHLRQGYAITAHRAQGSTINWALTLVDDTWYRELGYSALSRARLGTELYLTGIELDNGVDHHSPGHTPEPLTALAQHFGRSRAEQAALQAVPQLADLGDPDAARAAWDELDILAARLAKDQPADFPPSVDPSARMERPFASRRRSEQERRRITDDRRLRQLEGQLQYRERLLGAAVRYQQPEWATKLLGSLPTSRRGEAAWLTAAGALAAYLERFKVADDLGEAASADAIRRHHDRVQRALQPLTGFLDVQNLGADGWTGIRVIASEKMQGPSPGGHRAAF
jgi:hypothetical protein